MKSVERRQFLGLMACGATWGFTSSCASFGLGSGKRAPNILFITADDMNYDSVGHAGCKIPNITPNIDRLASEGMRFDHAHVTIAVCQPSRSVLMTGRYPHRNGAFGFDPVDADVPTLPASLHAAGYLNGIFAKETHLAPKEKFYWDTYVPGVALGMGRDPKRYYEESKAFFARAKEEGVPFFLMANSCDPHRPFAGSDREKMLKKKYNKELPGASRYYKPWEVEVQGFLPDLPDVRQEVSEYYTSVHRCDETVGEILRALKGSGLEDNTLVMFISDNGMALPFAKTISRRIRMR